MDRLPLQQTWRSRVAALLDDPVCQAVLRRDGITRDEVLDTLEPMAERLGAAARPDGRRRAA